MRATPLLIPEIRWLYMILESKPAFGRSLRTLQFSSGLGDCVSAARQSGALRQDRSWRSRAIAIGAEPHCREPFHRYAGQTRFRHHIGVTYEAVELRAIVGFVTVSLGQLEADAVLGSKRWPPYPIPVLRIARLGTSESARGRGVGKTFFASLSSSRRDFETMWDA